MPVLDPMRGLPDPHFHTTAKIVRLRLSRLSTNIACTAMVPFDVRERPREATK